ncbi:4-(cytidine 5'-diphospho)-2-C-methyl-D-erythritol kinase [Acaricomes phytoseiuli]|uniref:4-(cytidine 5'-diphospho)-2-C-methyl-D-erythritol kinase n=1 Tax=Acaricomes phytoseiuli TaxID=291968 RepID=UPI0006888BBC|nr:4-(cytidine 5'-diphospho)-2-C-methyl-D-erythritol kinase [Acaricomes phytoseiuli]MCW1249858.1 4-(cytidine 5'-diphospho)-2-C-methyl-D-erythritol kinase [Acaricomes phytoseiuli]
MKQPRTDPQSTQPSPSSEHHRSPNTLPRAHRSVRAKAPGKINVSFSVGPLRADGYHSVVSVYLAVSLYEEVIATATPESGVTVSIRPPEGQPQPTDVPLDDNNLAVRAAKLLAEISEQSTGVHLDIVKQVPVAGGMGGGSADAAAALLACDALWGSGLAREELAHLGAELGADVPFALLGGAAIGVGVGDELSPVLAPQPLHWVLVQAGYGLATPTVFDMLDRMRAAAGSEPAEPQGVDPLVLQALRDGDAEALAPLLSNDLQVAAARLAPQLKEVLALGDRLGALASLVSGSGPTVALLARDPEHAEDLATRVAQEELADGARCWAYTVHSPAHGAKIVTDLNL